MTDSYDVDFVLQATIDTKIADVRCLEAALSARAQHYKELCQRADRIIKRVNKDLTELTEVAAEIEQYVYADHSELLFMDERGTAKNRYERRQVRL